VTATVRLRLLSARLSACVCSPLFRPLSRRTSLGEGVAGVVSGLGRHFDFFRDGGGGEGSDAGRAEAKGKGEGKQRNARCALHEKEKRKNKQQQHDNN